jgi:acetate kinase
MLSKLVLILNCGSSSLKFSILNPETGEIILYGQAQQLGNEQANLTCNFADEVTIFPLKKQSSFVDALHHVMQWLENHQDVFNSIVAVGHRIVHGGEHFSQPTLMNRESIEILRGLSYLAPLHNPVNLLGLEAALHVFPNLPQVAVFDTAFHQTIPEKAFLYALPYSLYADHKIRRYGFHGSSYAYVSERVAQILGVDRKDARMIVAHLGNGASICAIKDGKSLDTSMGFTPLEGLVMGTRTGDLDPSIPAFLVEHLNLSEHDVQTLLNKKSGLLGLSEKTNDFRELERGYQIGDEACIRAVEVFAYRLAKYIAAYTVPLGGMDAIVFTGGIGENSALVRSLTLSYLSHLGISVNQALNKSMVGGREGLISEGERVQVLVIPTNEELMIAKEVYKLLDKLPK